MRDELSQAIKIAMKDKDSRTVATVRLIQAAIKDRDIANRGAGKDPVSDEDIAAILSRMVKQRQESAQIYQDNNRLELAEQEREEIAVIERFLPAQLSDEETEAACREVVEAVGAQGLRDMGKCMAALKAQYAGQMDFAKAGAVVKRLLQ